MSAIPCPSFACMQDADLSLSLQHHCLMSVLLAEAAMGDVANKDEASKALDVARAALDRGLLEKAQRFGEKAMRLYPNDEVIAASLLLS